MNLSSYMCIVHVGKSPKSKDAVSRNTPTKMNKLRRGKCVACPACLRVLGVALSVCYTYLENLCHDCHMTVHCLCARQREWCV